MNAQDGYGIYFFKPEHGAYGWAGADYNLAGKSSFARSTTKQARSFGNIRSARAGTAGVLTTRLV